MNEQISFDFAAEETLPAARSTVHPTVGEVGQAGQAAQAAQAEHAEQAGKQGVVDWLDQLVHDMRKFRVDIEAALSYGSNSHTFDNIVSLVLLGRVQFIPLEKSFLITEVHTMPNYKTYHVFLAGGDLEELMAYQPQLEANAAKANCKYLSLTGRRGWEKPLKTQGWSLKYVTLYKEIDDEQRQGCQPDADVEHIAAD